MKQFMKVSVIIGILLSVFYSYFSIIDSPKLLLQLFLPLLLIGLGIYYSSQFFLARFKLFRRKPLLQLLILYLVGITIGLIMTCASRGWTFDSLFLALKINIIGLPLFLGVLYYWIQQDQTINRELLIRQKQLLKTLNDES